MKNSDVVKESLENSDMQKPSSGVYGLPVQLAPFVKFLLC
ncbi:Protein ESKIMO 1 [Bienertia sinuspersici]